MSLFNCDVCGGELGDLDTIRDLALRRVNREGILDIERRRFQVCSKECEGEILARFKVSVPPRQPPESTGGTE